MRTDLLLVDDDDEFRAAARTLLGAAGFDVSAEATTGVDALAAVAAVRPAVVLLDVQLPDIDGFEIARVLRQHPEPPRIVFISTREGRDYGRRLAESGADGFIDKAHLSGASLRAILHAEGRLGA
jgi:CheY-like chemotaxis protein